MKNGYAILDQAYEEEASARPFTTPIGLRVRRRSLEEVIRAASAALDDLNGQIAVADADQDWHADWKVTSHGSWDEYVATTDHASMIVYGAGNSWRYSIVWRNPPTTSGGSATSAADAMAACRAARLAGPHYSAREA